MNNLHRIFRLAGSYRVRAPLALILAAVSATTLWFATASESQAAPPATCPVCHKHVATLPLLCGSLAYRRHKDHGDTDGPCGATTSNTFFSGNQVLKPFAPVATTNR